MKNLKISSFSEYQKQYEFSITNPDLFWDGVASTFLWKKKWDKLVGFFKIALCVDVSVVKQYSRQTIMCS